MDFGELFSHQERNSFDKPSPEAESLLLSVLSSVHQQEG